VDVVIDGPGHNPGIADIEGDRRAQAHSPLVGQVLPGLAPSRWGCGYTLATSLYPQHFVGHALPGNGSPQVVLFFADSNDDFISCRRKGGDALWTTLSGCSSLRQNL
jgi:hypothetical protein